MFYTLITTCLPRIIDLIDEHQGCLTLLLFFLGYILWIYKHQRERESKYCCDIFEKINVLHYLILEIRQPKSLPENMSSYVDDRIEPFAEKIRSLSYEILKIIRCRNEIIQNKSPFNFWPINCLKKAEEASYKKLTKLYKDEISEKIIAKIMIAIIIFQMTSGDEDKDIAEIFFPFEMPLKKNYHIDNCGLYLANDTFGKLIEQSFHKVLQELKKSII